MLFSIKNRLAPALFLFVIFVFAAFSSRYVLGLSWQIEIHEGFFRDLALGLGVIVSSDIILHCALWFVLQYRYLSGYRTLVEYFRPQNTLSIAAGGLLAAGEELIFRGVILHGLIQIVGMRSSVAIGISALAFGSFHLIWDRRLAPFALWAVWEGAILGYLYILSGSLLLCMIVHLIHDVCSFSLFAFQRRTGFLLR